MDLHQLVGRAPLFVVLCVAACEADPTNTQPDDSNQGTGGSAVTSATGSGATAGGAQGDGGTGATGLGPVGTGGAPPTGGALYTPCSCDDDGCHDEECQSGICAMGFCTQPCAGADECTMGGGCIAFVNEQLCLPHCSQKLECESAYGVPSTCAYGTPVDGGTPEDVPVCADWGLYEGAPIHGAPNGTSCTDDLVCNLDNDHIETVCDLGQCATGVCHEESDCPLGQACTNAARTGTCQ